MADTIPTRNNTPATEAETSPTARSERRPRGTALSPAEQEQALHLHDNRYGTRAIAKRLGRDRKTIRRFLERAGRDVPAIATPRHLSRPSKLEPFRDSVREKVAAGLTTTRILRELRDLGYDGGRSILNDLVRSLRPAASGKAVKRRFETRPGEEMQIDWSVYTVPIAGCPTRVHALSCILAYSRRVHIRFYRNERQSTLLEGLARAFEAFEGVTLRLVFDNMATVVLGRLGPGRRVLWHPRLLDFASHYGTQPFACRVRDPDRKGKTERVLWYCERDLVRGSTFTSFDELNERASHWCDEVANRRVHGTTGRIPLEAWDEERAFLVQLPDRRFGVYDETVRDIGPASTLSIAGTPYTVPQRLAPNRNVPVRLYAEHFEVLDSRGEVAFSRRYVDGADKGRLQIDPTHYEPRRHEGDASGGRIDELFVRCFPSLEPFVEALTIRTKTLAHVHLRALWRLAAAYGDGPFLRAATRVQEYRRFSVAAVRRLLERDYPEVTDGADTATLKVGSRAGSPDVDIDGGSLESYRDLETPRADADNTPTGSDQQKEDDDDQT